MIDDLEKLEGGRFSEEDIERRIEYIKSMRDKHEGETFFCILDNGFEFHFNWLYFLDGGYIVFMMGHKECGYRDIVTLHIREVKRIIFNYLDEYKKVEYYGRKN